MTSKTHVAFVAGPGIATVLSQVKTLLTQDATARVMLFYGNDTSAQVESLEDLQALKDQHLDRLSLHFLFSGDPQDVELFNGRLDDGKVRELAKTLFEPAQVEEFLIAGPNGTIAELSATLQALGVQPIRIRGRQDDQPLPAPTPKVAPAIADAPQLGENATQVTVLMDGRRRSFVMERDGGSVLEAAEQAGFDLPFSCRAGVCSTCRTKVVKGSVEMTQNYALEPWELEEGYVLACQSHPTTPELELDYDDK